MARAHAAVLTSHSPAAILAPTRLTPTLTAHPHPHPIQVAAESSDYSNVPLREGIEEQDRYERTLMNAAGNDGGVTYMQKPGTKGKGKEKAPAGSVAEELGY